MPLLSNQPFTPDFSNEIDIESIISAPLVAVSKANVMMVTGQTRFLLEYCFTKKEDDSYAPVMIEMVMVKGIIDHTKEDTDPDYIRKVEMTFSMPLLCLVPINSLAIDKVNIEFDMEITSVNSREAEVANQSGQKVVNKQAQLNGKISYDHNRNNPENGKYKSNMSSKLKVDIHAGPLPLPVGVLAVLDLYTKAIQPVPRKEIPTP